MKIIIVIVLIFVSVLASDFSPEPECQDIDKNCTLEICERKPNMYARCQYTCGKCQETPCRDSTVIDCNKYEGYCHDTNYIDQLKIYCPRFCGFCNPENVCRDKTSGCKDMVEDCHEPIIQKYCQRTCKACEHNNQSTYKEEEQKYEDSFHMNQEGKQNQEEKKEDNYDNLDDVKLDYEDDSIKREDL